MSRLRESGELELKLSSLRHVAEFQSVFENKQYESALIAHSNEPTCLPILILLMLEIDQILSAPSDASEDKLINFQKVCFWWLEVLCERSFFVKATERVQPFEIDRVGESRQMHHQANRRLD